VARKIAEIKSITFEEVANQTTLNAQKLFNINS
jgi:Tat protein secretion system quality control protein TatD with DNase activity